MKMMMKRRQPLLQLEEIDLESGFEKEHPLLLQSQGGRR